MGTLNIEIKGSIGVIKFNNPPYNFMSAEMVRELDQVTRAFEKDCNVRAIILTSDVEGVFITHYEIDDILSMFSLMQITPKFLRGVNTACCLAIGKLLRCLDRLPPFGAFLESLLLKTPLSGVVELECLHRVLHRLQCMDKVVVAAINGEAMGGATELALACDFRLMAEGDYRFGLPEVTVAILPGGGGTQRMVRMVGVGKALELMLEGTMLTPGEGRDCGLVHRVVEGDQLMNEAFELAHRMAKRPSVSVGWIKRAVRLGGSMSFMRGMEVEKKGFYTTGYTKDAFSAFEYYGKEFEKGRTDREIISSFQSGEPVEYRDR